MATDPSPRALELHRKWLGTGTVNAITSLIMAGVLVFCWFARGPDHPIFGLLVAGWSLVLGTVLAGPLMFRLPASWFRVPAGEHVLHRILGVGAFGLLLDLSGWNRHIALPMRGFDGTKGSLRSLELSVRAGLCGHGAGFAIHLLLAAFALFTRHPWGALWIVLPGVVFHLYPVLLQRSIMLRVQAALDRSVRLGGRRAQVTGNAPRHAT